LAEELGKIEKPLVSEFSGERKLYLVPLIFRGVDAPEDYLELFERFWKQVKEQIAKLEVSLGKVNHVYHELVSVPGDAGTKVLERMSPSSFLIVSEEVLAGARFEATDDKDMLEEAMDWERCLIGGLISAKVEKVVSDFYLEASRKRYEHIAARLDSTLKAGETGMFFIREGHRVQFPASIQVISVAPPALDEIHRWLRNRVAEAETKTGGTSK
jgi:hypothetical protein